SNAGAAAEWSYGSREWAAAELSSDSGASVRNVKGLPISGTLLIASGCGPDDGNWMRRNIATASVTKTRTTRRAVWALPPSDAQAAGLCLGIAGCDAAHIRLLARIRSHARLTLALPRDAPRRPQTPTPEI